MNFHSASTPPLPTSSWQFLPNSEFQKDSSARRLSHNVEHFNVLLLEVFGINNLIDSLIHLEAPESLTGTNQYCIDSQKYDAVRTMHIIKTPPFLIIQLKRFKYDHGTAKLTIGIK
jgi:ubiquitin C-terminal hydrolase